MKKDLFILSIMVLFSINTQAYTVVDTVGGAIEDAGYAIVETGDKIEKNTKTTGKKVIKKSKEIKDVTVDTIADGYDSAKKTTAKGVKYTAEKIERASSKTIQKTDEIIKK